MLCPGSEVGPVCAHLSLWQLVTQIVPQLWRCGSGCMWKWVRTVIPYERREQRNCQTCHSLLHSNEKIEDGDERGKWRGGDETERLRHRDKERKTETEGKGRGNWEKTMMEQKGGDLEAREQAREGVGGERKDQSGRGNRERMRLYKKKQCKRMIG